MFAYFLGLATAHILLGPPPPLRYRIELHLTWEIDRPAVGAKKQNGSAMELGFVTVNLADTVGGQIAHVVIDSLTTQGSGLMEMAFDSSVGKAAKGVFYHLRLVNGKARELAVPSAPTPATTSLSQAIAMLFPAVKAESKVGDSWPDTTIINSTARGGVQAGLNVTNWTVAAVQHDTVSLTGATSGHSVVTGNMPSTAVSTGTRAMTYTPQGQVWSATSDSQQQMTNTRSDSTERIAAQVTVSIGVKRVP